MKKLGFILLVLFIMTVFISGCSQPSGEYSAFLAQNDLPEIVFDAVLKVSYIQIIEDSSSHNQIILTFESSETEILFPQDFNLHLFELRNAEWIEIKHEKPFSTGDVLLKSAAYTIENEFNLIISPVFSETKPPPSLRVIVYGNENRNDQITEKLHGAVLDIDLHEFVQDEGLMQTVAHFSAKSQEEYAQMTYSRFPNLLLNFGTDFLSRDGYDCENYQPTLTMISQYPYDTFNSVSNDPESKTNLYSWTMDGSQIVFIQPNPGYEYLFPDSPQSTEGYDQIKIMDQQGDIVFESGIQFAHTDFYTKFGLCSPKTAVISVPALSPSQNLIAFATIEREQLEEKHRLVFYDIEKDAILQDVGDINPGYWFADSDIYYAFDQIGLVKFSFYAGDQVKKEVFPFPKTNNSVNLIRVFDFAPQRYITNFGHGHSIYGVISEVPIFDDGEYSAISELWVFSDENETWKKVFDFQALAKIPRMIFDDFVIVCDQEDQIIQYDLKTGNKLKTISFKNGQIQCETLQSFMDENGKPGYGFWVQGENAGLWVQDPYVTDKGPAQVIHAADVKKSGGEQLFLINLTFGW